MIPLTAEITFDLNLGTVAAGLAIPLILWLVHSSRGVVTWLQNIDQRLAHQDECMDRLRGAVSDQVKTSTEATLKATQMATAAALDSTKLAADLAKEASLERAEILQRLARLEKSAKIAPLNEVGG